MQPRIGVLALQGAFAAHQQRFAELGTESAQVRTAADLDRCDALVVPGGESTTMSKLLVSSGLAEPLAARVAAGLPVFGTCAGMILMAREVLDGRPDQWSLGAVDITVRRNGYGRQVDSFEADLALATDPANTTDADDRPFHGVFIRAPKVEAWSDRVEIIATHDGVPVLVRQGPVLLASFHPELTHDARLHASFLDRLADPPVPPASDANTTPIDVPTTATEAR